MMEYKFWKQHNLHEWYKIVRPIITSKEFLKRKKFAHHGDETVYEHSIKVSIASYKLAKKLGIDYKSAAIAGVLHDLYTTPWMEDTEIKPLLQRHGFTHARIALDNSRKYYKKYLNPVIENAILRHMFPLNIIPPKYKVGILLTLVDKYMSLNMLVSRKSMLALFRGIIRSS